MPPHLKHVTTLPRNLSLITSTVCDCRSLSDITVSHGSVATHMTCGGIFNKYFAANLLENVRVKKNWNIHTYTRLTALCPGIPRWAGTIKVKPIWILLKQEAVSGSGISWAICKSAHRSRQITTPAPHHSLFYICPSCRPASKHWRH